VIPKFRSTADLLNEFAPYIEPVVSGDVLIGVNWKFVAAADPAGIATAPVSGGVGTIRVDHSGSESPFRWTSGGAYFEAESEPSSTATFDTSFPIASVTRIRLNFYLQESSQVSPYAWDFYPVSADSVPEPSPDPDPTPEPNPDPGPGPTPTPDPEPTDPTAPPTVPDTTTTAVVPATENPGRHFSLSIVAAGGVPIPNNVQFHFWFIVEISSSAGIRAADTSAYVGPFVARSVTSASGATTLDIDADNLKKPDGSKGSVPAGSYRVKFADSETGQKYVGTTPVAITIEETATVPDRPVNPNPSPSSQGGGGCNAGYGTIGLLLLTGVALRRRRIR
jgi:Synergist-CTERM protein sorting domain-containing protein